MERIPVQPFHQDPESGAVPLENLDQCASAIAEGEHTAGIRVEMEFQLDDCGQTGIALAQIGHATGQIDGCASRKIKHSLSKPAGAQPSAGRGSLRQLQSGYFPEEGLLQENSLRRHHIAAPVLKEALRTPDQNYFQSAWPFPESFESNSLG